MLKKLTSVITVFGLLLGFAALAVAAEEFKEWPISEEPVKMNGMEIAGVYFQPVDEEPRGMDLPKSQADVHIECDIAAMKGNKNGLGAGDWVPYLTISYVLKNLDTGKIQRGTFMPMMAKDGPHYGSNVKMMGAGNYQVTFTLEPPSRQGFVRHSDEATGVGKWWKPFDVTFKWKYVPIPEEYLKKIGFYK